jgi:hypothetical protein
MMNEENKIPEMEETLSPVVNNYLEENTPVIESAAVNDLSEVEAEVEVDSHVQVEVEPIEEEVILSVEEILPEASDVVMQTETEAETHQMNQVPVLPEEAPDAHLTADNGMDSEVETEESEELTSTEEPYASVDYSTLSKEELMALSAEALTLIPKESVKRLQNIRPYLDEMFKQDKKAALLAHTEVGNEADTFEYAEDINKDRFYAFLRQAQDARTDERKRIEEEKMKNLIRKRQLLAELKALTEADETRESVDQVKKIQAEWKTIRAVPNENVQELWDSYNFYLNKFYDNHSINLELKDLDRKKNLYYKIDLCKKVEELHQETSAKKCFILLNKYQDEFKNTGPVPKEFNEEIWTRFKTALDAVYAEKKVLLDEMDAVHNENLKLKEILVEKATLISSTAYDNIKQWNHKTDELNILFEEWKKIGPVPKANNEPIWKAFREQFNEFYKNKSAYFEQINKDRKANLLFKEDLCKQAEALMNNDDFAHTTKEFLRLQEEWKKGGPVPEKVSNAIWKRFRTACDTFFENKNRVFKDKKKQEEESLNDKLALIARVNALLETEDKDNAVQSLKEIHQLWQNAGFVPFNKKNEVHQAYEVALQAVNKKFDIRRERLNEGSGRTHYSNVLSAPNGGAKVKQEEIKIKEKIRFLEGEIATWENNIEFFARSKNAEKLKQEIQSKIDKSNGQIDRLKKELKEIKSLATEKV